MAGHAAPKPDPYAPLRAYLAAHAGDEVTLTFSAIETLLGAPLPDAAWHRAWWTNAPQTVQAQAWLRSGWWVHWVRRSTTDAAVTFTRASRTRLQR